jgi:hypothetical protein
MQKKILIGFILLIQLNVTAQPIRDLRFGAKIAPSFSWISSRSNNATYNGTKLGNSVALMLDYPINGSEKFFFNAEIMYNLSGGRILFDGNEYAGLIYNNIRYTYRMPYIDLPIGIKYKSRQFGSNQIYINANVQPSFLLSGSARAKVENAPYNDNRVYFNTKDFDNYDGVVFTDDIKAGRLGWVLGAGIEREIFGDKNGVFGLRYDSGFTDVWKDKNLKGRNTNLSLVIGLYFN